MNLLIVSTYFLAVISLGLLLLGDALEDGVERLLAALIIGALPVGSIFYTLSLLGFINNYSIYVIIASLLATLFAARQKLLASFSATGRFLKQQVIGSDKFSFAFTISAIVLVAWIILLAHAPERNADAMRYHLAQLEDIVRHGALIFRPYLHYQFPLYFSMSFLPVYWFAGGVGMQLAVCLFFLLAVFTALYLAHRVGVTKKRLLFFLIFLVPMSYHEAHNVFNDWVINYCYLVAALLLVKENLSQNLKYLFLAFVCVGYALGIKYQAILMIPWMLLIAFYGLKDLPHGRRLVILAASLALMTIVASPFYLRNALMLGNPVFPLLAKHFHGNYPYFDQIAVNFSQGMTGRLSLATLLLDLKNFLSFTHIPAIFWLFSFVGAYYARAMPLRPLLGIASFWGAWLLITPQLYMRFAFFALPLALVAAMFGYERLLTRLPKLVATATRWGMASVLSLCSLVAVYYSIDYFSYFKQQDLQKFHSDTWFYPTFQWIAANTPENAKFLALLSAGQTYYLPREHLRADEGLSALVEWPRVNSDLDLAEELARHHLDYVVIAHELVDSAANKPRQLLATLADKHLLEPVYNSRERLTSSRIHRIYGEVQVTVYRVNYQKITAELEHAYS